MALTIPTYQFGPFATQSTNAYAWIGFLAVDFYAYSGRTVVFVHANKADADAGKPPLDQIGIALGETLVPAQPNASPPVAAVTFPALPDLFGSAATIQATTPANRPDQSLRSALYTALKAHPKLVGATDAL